MNALRIGTSGWVELKTHCGGYVVSLCTKGNSWKKFFDFNEYEKAVVTFAEQRP